MIVQIVEVKIETNVEQILREQWIVVDMKMSNNWSKEVTFVTKHACCCIWDSPNRQWRVATPPLATWISLFIARIEMNTYFSTKTSIQQKRREAGYTTRIYFKDGSFCNLDHFFF